MHKLLQRHKYFTIFVLLLVFVMPTSIYLIRSGFVGADSYHYLTYLCQETSLFEPSTQAPLVPTIFSILPCNEIILKIIIMAFFGLTLLAIYLIGEETKKGTGLLTILFTTLSPALLWISLKFENDFFAYPIMFLGVYFFLRHVNKKSKHKDLLISIFLLLFGAGIWPGTLYFILIFTILEPKLLLLTIPLLAYFQMQLIQPLLPRPEIRENLIWDGLMLTGFFMFHWWGKKLPELHFYYLPITITFILIGIINPKFIILAIPFLSLTILKVYENSNESDKNVLIKISVFTAIIFSLSIYAFQGPTQTEHTAVQETIQYANQHDLNIANDWTYGHLIYYYGEITKQHSGPGDYNLNQMPNKAILSREDLNCVIVKQYTFPIQGNALRLYNC